MKRLVVYYKTDENYARTKNANIWVSINGSAYIGPEDTNSEIIKGEVQTAVLARERYDPVGIFSPTGAWYTMRNLDGETSIFAYGEGGTILPIDYESVSPQDLENRLRLRIACLKNEEYLSDPDTIVECYRGTPPSRQS
jgi:hypothetical protein